MDGKGRVSGGPGGAVGGALKKLKGGVVNKSHSIGKTMVQRKSVMKKPHSTSSESSDEDDDDMQVQIIIASHVFVHPRVHITIQCRYHIF